MILKGHSRFFLPILVILFLLHPLAAPCAGGLKPVSKDLLEYLSGENSQRVLEIRDFPGDQLPEGVNGLLVVRYPEDSQHLILVGRGEGNAYYDLGALRFSGEINIAKGDGYYDKKDRLIHIYFQMPYSALYFAASYRWDREKAAMTQAGEESGDPSAEALQQVDSLLAAGEIKKAGEKLGEMMYPGHYYNEYEMAVKFAKKAHSAAVSQFKQGSNTSWQLISDAMTPFDSLTGNRWLLGFKSAADFEKSRYASYIKFPDMATIVNDYGFMLEQAGKLSDAENVLIYVLRLAPDRTPAHLNIADALFKSGKTMEARKHYQRYIELMKMEGKEKLIPSRAYERAGR